MKKVILLSSALALAACGHDQDVLSFYQDAHVESARDTGGTTSEGTGGATCGATGQGGAPSNPYRPGGYGGHVYGSDSYAFLVARDGIRTTLDQYELCVDPGEEHWPVNAWEGSTCRAGSLCSLKCQTDADCGALDGPLAASCAHDETGGGNCVLPCESDSDCLEGMLCLDDVVWGASCMIAETPWYPGCESYCLDASDKNKVFHCGVDGDCCAGLSCSPSGLCQERACLPASWSCTQDGVPCCEGTTCQGGFCQP
jgi:hypothetical protein